MALVTFRQIRYFIAVAESGKISAAASMLGISPSVVTEAVSELETLSRMKLFQRQPRGLDLTYEGHRFLAHCRNILSAVEGANEALARPDSEMEGTLKLATTITVAGYFLAPLLSRFQRTFPNIQVRVMEEKRLNLEEGLIDGRHDLALMLVSNLSNRQKLLSHTLVHSMRRLWLPPKHPLLSQEIVTLADVACPALYPARHRRCRVHDRRLLACAQSAAQHHHSHRIGRGHPQPDRASPRRHNTFRYDVSAVVT
jgi:DNA-binding transcriptional LysR family regulator